jgi:general secretion pathway protein J
MARCGYTLIELLVVLGVLSLVAVLLLSGLSGKGDAWVRMDRATSRGEAVEAAYGLLRTRLQQAVPATRYDMRPAGPDFDGEAARLTFLAPPADRQGPGALRRYRLLLDAGGDLVLEVVSDVAVDPTRPERRDVLLRGVGALDISYFGQVEPDPNPHWRSNWRQRPRMPSLVRIRIEPADPKERRWPDLVVHPLADIDTECVLVAQTGGCRSR